MPTFYFFFAWSPFHRIEGCEGSRSVAERSIAFLNAKKNYTPQGGNEPVARFAVANIVTIFLVFWDEWVTQWRYHIQAISDPSTIIHGKYPAIPHNLVANATQAKILSRYLVLRSIRSTFSSRAARMTPSRASIHSTIRLPTRKAITPCRASAWTSRQLPASISTMVRKSSLSNR